MELIKEFVVTLVSTLVLITAVEIILPDNSMKKYSKFILGAMLIGVILNPILKFLNNGEEVMTKKIISYENNKVTTPEVKENSNKAREESFKQNFSRNINNILKNKFDKYEFKSTVECTVNFETMDFIIDEVIVYVENNKEKKVDKVEKVEEVVIGEEKKEEVKSDKQYEEIRTFLADELNINKEKIKIVEKE